MKLPAVLNFVRRWRWLIVVLLIGAGIALASSGGDESYQPYSPSSAERDGTKALALLTQELGGEFTESPGPPVGEGVQLMMGDSLSQAETQRLRDWVRSGGRVVTVGADSELAQGVESGSAIGRTGELPAQCTDPVVQGVGAITANPSIFDAALKPGPGDIGCFPVYDDEYLMVAHRLGLGTVYVLATPGPLTNELIGESDNSVLAANLLDMGDGRQVVFSETDEAAGGQKGLVDLLPSSAIAAIAQLAIAGLILVLWRWRRLGRPVEEQMPVETPASALVVAAGTMSERAERHDYAARLMRNDLRRLLIERLGLSRDAPDHLVVEVAAVRLGIDRQELTDVLGSPHESKALVKLAQRIESIHQEVAHGR